MHVVSTSSRCPFALSTVPSSDEPAPRACFAVNGAAVARGFSLWRGYAVHVYVGLCGGGGGSSSRWPSDLVACASASSSRRFALFSLKPHTFIPCLLSGRRFPWRYPSRQGTQYRSLTIITHKPREYHYWTHSIFIR